MSSYAVDVDNVVKYYPTGFLGRKRKGVLDGVSFHVPEGAVYGVLGPNGAGKTTLMSIMANLITADSGTVRMFGRDVARHPDFVRRQINLCSGNPNFTWCMTVTENLTFYGMLYGMWGRDLRGRVDAVIALMELQPFRRTRFDELSTGTKQRLALAKALLTGPKVLFLDEPTLGLDPNIAIKTRQAIRDIHAERGITIFLTSHYMKEVEDLCDIVVFLRDGRIAAEGTPAELKQRVAFKVNQPTMEDVFMELLQ